ncbi:MAG: hypothetical protein A2X28_01930 [Elusimicrobia bacterium GWA2_56_46]|nr:MAG: hypothetical protein A2X28_01930 [Elusimicrobia bacterium GWA2_56_46]OGR55470.1 MAG: hypothetical protein A2X39_01035 [Elusimicrobia bacterium GWC2_56_31]HBW21938.1 hypothetical protein [Elusimicrobiota bacterium]
MKTKLLYAAAALWLSAFAAGITLYPGSKLIYTIFSLAFLALLVSGFYRQVTYGYTLLAVFLWLGFWLKKTIHLIYPSPYMDAGLFDGSPGSWNKVLLISTVGALGALAARAIYSWFKGVSTMELRRDRTLVPDWYPPVRGWIWGSLIVFVTGLSVFNAYWGIHQIGMVPMTIFPWPVNAMVAWTLNIGVAIAIAILLYWDVCAGYGLIAPLLAVVYEAIITSVSILSRGTFVYHAVPAVFAVIKNRMLEIRGFRWSVVFYLGLFTLALLLTFFMVTGSRDYYHFGRRAIDADKSATEIVTMAYSVYPSFDEFSQKIIVVALYRWIGLDGVMSVYAYPKKGMSLLAKAAMEKRTISAIPLFERVSGSRSQYMDTRQFQFGGIPGSVGFFYYSGRVWTVFLGLCLLTLVVLVLERLVWQASRNPFLCSIIGMTVANTVAQFGTAPRQMFPHFGIILVVAGLVRLFQKRAQSLTNTR